MKKLLILFALVTVNLQGQDVTLIDVYNGATSDQERLEALVKIQEGDVPPSQEFYEEALKALLVSQVDRGEPQELGTKYQIAKLILAGLGDAPSPTGADALWALFEEAKDPVLKGQALVAYGATKEEKTVSRLVRVLTRLNLSSTKTRVEETLAHYCVMALANTGSPEAFEVLFSASRAWYSSVSKVRELALKSLGSLRGDVSEGLNNVIIWSLDFETKAQAMEYLSQEIFSGPQKSIGAKSALDQGLKWQPGSEQEARSLARLRDLALIALLGEKDRDPEVVPMIQRALKIGNDTSEILRCLQVLGANGTDTAVKVLSDYLRRLNDKNKSGGLQDFELTLVRQLIASLGATGNPNARGVLTEVEFSQYTPGIMRDAKKSLDALPQ